MLFRTALFVAIVALVFTAPAVAQNWNSAHAGSWTQVICTYESGSYIWAFTNLSGGNDHLPAHDVLAWTLQPFNVPEPESVEAPAGWVWDNSGGWSMFKVADSNSKYAVEGPALEPGETLVFKYTPKIDTTPLNSLGLQEGGLAFTSHLAAVNGTKGAKWDAAEGEYGPTWHEKVMVFDSASTTTPEPSGLLLLATGLASVWGVAARRKRL